MSKFKATKADAGQRADVFTAKKLVKFSRSSLQNLFELKKVMVNRRNAKASQRLDSGDLVEVDTSLLNTPKSKVDIEILYEDDDVVVMNKPAGLLTHSKGALNTEPTVADFLVTKISDKNLKGNRAGIVHRLDRTTSGVIIGAKTEAALKYLQKQFANRRVKKSYLAIVEGSPEPQKALIDAPIGRDPRNPKSFKVTASGKPAQTQYKVIRTVAKSGKQYSLVEVQPLTGRTHQIRVHMAYIGHPVVGDPLYSQASANTPVYLHASELELTLPSGQRRSFKVPTPDIFKEIR